MYLLDARQTKHAIQPADGVVKLGSRVRQYATTASGDIASPFELRSFRLYPLLNNLHQIRPPSGLVFAHLTKVDDITMVRVRRAIVHLLATDVRKDPLLVPRVSLNQLLPLRCGRSPDFASSSARARVIGLAMPFLSVSSNVKPMPRTMLP